MHCLGPRRTPCQTYVAQAPDSIGGHTRREVLGHAGASTLPELADCQVPSLSTPSAGGIGSSQLPDLCGLLPLVPI